MVLQDYNSVDEVYNSVKKIACGRVACSIMLLVACEVDSMASAKILTQLLRTDNIAYKIRPVANFSNISQAFEEIDIMDIKTIFMINCGAMYNIPKLLGIDRLDDVRCIIFDNHRPIHLANIHSKHNVVVMDYTSSDENQYPSDGSDLSDEDSSSDENENENDDDPDDLSDDKESDQEEEEEEEADLDEIDGDGDGDVDVDGDPDENSDEEDDGSNPDDKQDGVHGGADGGEVVVDEDKREEAGSDHENGDIKEVTGDISENDDDGGVSVKDDEEQVEPAERHPDVEDENDEELVKGKKRKYLAEKHDPVKIRRRNVRSYYSGNGGLYYTVPTAVLLINLVKLLNKSCTNDIIWNAILGATDQFQRSHITEDLYNTLCDAIKQELTDAGNSKYTIGAGQEEVAVPGAENGQVASGLEYRFYLYRHWSLLDSMQYSNYVSSKMKSYKAHGEQKLKEMLARMGIPLQQCTQSYMFMNPMMRTHFREQITSNIAEEFNLKDPGVMFKSFFRYNSFKNPVSASDVVHAVTALMEMGTDDVFDTLARASSNESKALTEPAWLSCFNKAFDCISMKSNTEESLKKGISIALSIQKAIVGQGISMIERQGSIITVYQYRYGIIPRSVSPYDPSSGEKPIGFDNNGQKSESIFARPAVLSRLAHFILEIQQESGTWSRKKAKPLVLAAERNNISSTFIVVGVNPGSTASNSINFGKMFLKAAREANAKSTNDGFDTSYIEIDKNDINAFFECLMLLLRKTSNGNIEIF